MTAPPPPATRLDGRNAIVTGAAAGGMGEAIARLFHAAGANVVLADADLAGAEAAARGIDPGAARALPFGMDVRRDDECAALAAFCEQRFGTADILVNAAGIIRFEQFGETTRATMADQFDVNAFGLLIMTQIVAERMVAAGRRGSIINIASMAGRRGQPDGPAYAASKAAVISLTQATALALAPHGVRANAVAPGFTISKMWGQIEDNIASTGADLADFRRDVTATVPLGALARPTDMAQAVLFLAADQSSYVTGQTLNVDGGLRLN